MRRAYCLARAFEHIGLNPCEQLLAVRKNDDAQHHRRDYAKRKQAAADGLSAREGAARTAIIRNERVVRRDREVHHKALCGPEIRTELYGVRVYALPGRHRAVGGVLHVRETDGSAAANLRRKRGHRDVDLCEQINKNRKKP